jgi:molecular chaperone GrpE
LNHHCRQRLPAELLERRLSDNNGAAEDAAEASFSGENEQAESTAVGEDHPGQVTDSIEALRQQADENWNRYLRSVAEIDNLRKRSSRELENARKFGSERLVSAILPVRDSLEAGLKAAQELEPQAVDIAALVAGEQATLRLLDQALEAAGVLEIDPEGEPFDPARHEAISLMPSPTAEPNSVIAVVQKGYALHERIVRPARVVVAQPPREPESGA